MRQSKRQRWLETLGRAVPVIACCACAPLGNFRPASVPAADRSAEVGAAVAVVSSRAFVDEPARAAGQVWTQTHASAGLTLCVLGAFDEDALAIGGAAKLDVVDSDRIAVGMEVELGYAWAAFSVPVAIRAFGRSWAYTAPRIGTWGTQPLLSLPAGVSLHAGDGVFLRAEGQALLQSFAWNERRWLAGAALAYQWRADADRNVATTGR